MYKSYFGLTDEPFRMTPDTRFLFRSHRHEEAMSSLLYGIGEKKGFIVITGEIGTGKTTLCRTLLNQLDPATKTAVILNPSLSKVELLHSILDDLSIDVPGKNPSQKTLLDELNKFLIEQARAGGNVAVIIDEAQNLDADVLESIRMLSNLETEQEKLLQIILVGQPELNEILKLPKLEQLRQRIAVRYHITPLERTEIPEYIAHRLLVAGNAKCVEFTPDAIDAIAEYTRGTPRLLNVICDKCLLAAYATRTKQIDGRLAATAIMDHDGPMIIAPAFSVPRTVHRPAPVKWKNGIKPAVAAGAIVSAVLAVGLFARPNVPVSADSEVVAQPPAPVAAAAPASRNAVAEVGALWKIDEKFAAGMSEIALVADLGTLAEINLPALVRSGTEEFALVRASAAGYELYGGGRRFEVSKLSPESRGIFQARILLPAHLAYPSDPQADPNFLPMLEIGLNGRARGETVEKSVKRFQAASRIPVDGIVGPLTWASLVSRAHPEFPHLTQSL